ncbi:unnamed protein product [Mytilus coruscus]|uniref:MULE transposase domain-containing protein n=1 Tax=Mytilus coruscus TaxID=42192 RepID=A0A6J8AGH4_MYTCO|nr:unnamed protein product [Mytilus coruscus]
MDSGSIVYMYKDVLHQTEIVDILTNPETSRTSNVLPYKPKANEVYLFQTGADDWKCDQYLWINNGTKSVTIVFEDRPIMPVAFLIHGRKKEKTHARFFEFVASSFPKINKTSVPFVTDREIGLVNAIRKNFPACDVLMCWNHLVKDLKFNLQQMGADQANTALYVSHLKDLLRCDSEAEYMTLKDDLIRKWSKPVVVYFEKMEKDILTHSGKWVIDKYQNLYDPFSGITNNACESMNAVIKRLNKYRELPVDCFVLSMFYLQNYYINEVQRGLAGIGNYTLRTKFHHASIPKDEINVPKQLVKPVDIVKHVMSEIDNVRDTCSKDHISVQTESSKIEASHISVQNVTLKMGKRFEIRLSALPSAQSPDTPELNKKQKHAKVMRERRAKWNEQQKQENKERSRIRMQNMRERKKKEHTQKSVSKNILTRHELKKEEERKRVQREKKRQYRETLSSQKRKEELKKKTETRKDSEIVPVQNDQSNQVSKQWTKPALRKAISRVKSALPRSPSKRQKGVEPIENKRKDTISKDTTDSVNKFLMREDISINVPNIKAMKANTEDHQFVLQKSMTEIYSDWKAENQNTKLSKSKFLKMRPKNVKLQNQRKLIQCLCEYCENVNLKITAFNNFAVRKNQQHLRIRDKYEAINMILCEKNGEQFNKITCIEGKCVNYGTENLSKRMEPLIIANEEIKWQKWDFVNVPNHKTGKEIKKRQLVTFFTPAQQLFVQLLDELQFLLYHLFVASWQQNQFNN